MIVTSLSGRLYYSPLFVKNNNKNYELSRNIILQQNTTFTNVLAVHQGNKTVLPSVVNKNGKLINIQLPFKSNDSSKIQSSIQTMLVSLSNIAKSQHYLRDTILVCY